MMKKINQLSISLVMVLLISSCTRDLRLSPISQISNASFWKTEEDAKGGLYGMYVKLRDETAMNFYFWGEARSEIMGPAVGGTAGYEVYYNNTLNAVNVATLYGGISPTWLGLYTLVHDANLILKYVPGINFKSEADQNNILAQAYAMRAFAYFVMARTWGGVPLVTEPTEGYSPTTTQKPKATVEEIFAFIKQDLEAAIKLYPNANYQTGRYLWTLPATNALKADVYLWTGKRLGGGNTDFTAALNALNEVEKSDVALLPKFVDVFDYTNKGNKEVIMAVRFQELESQQTVYNTMFSNKMPANITDASKAALGGVGLTAFSDFWWMPTALLRNQFSTDDQRKAASYVDIYTKEPGGGPDKYGYSVQFKHKGVISGGVRAFYDDYILYRYADILLMKAEAKNALNQDPSTEINKVRARAYGSNMSGHTFVGGSPADNDAAILKERLLELAFEGKRWWDLIRFDKAFDLVPSLQGKSAQKYLMLFPISEATLSLDPKVKQNDGY
ncbi:RagB/SusD family nutrient uptake outer membrane protein [Chitinophaga sp. MM2321]|uniref:RagB/SusD family nutrient uptake outer membrane protein n=1 Tax=Chitinophaga sp. MM2321 TaxID=3137178 RepID=UPI0032D59F95